MRIAAFDDGKLGVVGADGTLVDITDLLQQYEPLGPEDLLPDLITHFGDLRSELERRAATGAGLSLDRVRLRSPVTRPTKIACLIGNYREGTDRPPQILDFFKSPEAIIGPGDAVVLPPHPATIFHHEAELALVVGAQAKNLPADERALEALAGYTCAIDVSGRGLGRMGPSRIGKSFDTFTPLGPAIVTTDEVPDPQNLRVTLSVNGELRQDYSTSDMEYSVVEILAFISSYMTLVPGDVILCGTNHQGLGALQDGDHVVMTIERVGTLEVTVHDPLKREWSRGVDQEMAARVRGAARG
jgi:2-keto-4-pentenoate hydratase/2-oxohepta-3-ene-1,7-dioic acid hydratase in catechol pathway